MSAKEKDIVINLSGLGADKNIMAFTPYVTSNNANDNLKQYPPFSVDSVYTVPRRSIVTLIGEIAETSDIDHFHGNLPDQYRLFQNFPNPFNPETVIRFNLPKACDVVVQIYNIFGQEIFTLANEVFDAGNHSVIWDIKNNSGDHVSSGIYIYRIKAGKFVDAKKMSLLQ